MKMLKSINVNLDTDEIVGNLNTSQWQIIEICKALAKSPKFIVMDDLHDNVFFYNYIKKNNIKDYKVFFYKKHYVGLIFTN